MSKNRTNIIHYELLIRTSLNPYLELYLPLSLYEVYSQRKFNGEPLYLVLMDFSNDLSKLKHSASAIKTAGEIRLISQKLQELQSFEESIESLYSLYSIFKLDSEFEEKPSLLLAECRKFQDNSSALSKKVENLRRSRERALQIPLEKITAEYYKEFDKKTAILSTKIVVRHLEGYSGSKRFLRGLREKFNALYDQALTKHMLIGSFERSLKVSESYAKNGGRLIENFSEVLSALSDMQNRINKVSIKEQAERFNAEWDQLVKKGDAALKEGELFLKRPSPPVKPTTRNKKHNK